MNTEGDNGQYHLESVRYSPLSATAAGLGFPSFLTVDISVSFTVLT